jgi:hypothetical protein
VTVTSVRLCPSKPSATVTFSYSTINTENLPAVDIIRLSSLPRIVKGTNSEINSSIA